MSDDRWSLEASNILEPAKNWQVLGLYADGCSKSTRERLLERIPIKECAFNAFSQALGINPDEVVQTDLKEDWGEAPDVNFHGRQQELETIERWIIQDIVIPINFRRFIGSGRQKAQRACSHVGSPVMWYTFG